MSDYDLFSAYEPEQPATLEEERRAQAAPRQRRPSGGIYSIVTGLFMLATAGFIAWAVSLIMNPTAPYNPFPPPPPEPTSTLFVVDAGPQSATVLPPTWTASPSVTPGPTTTRRATATRTPSPGPTATGITPLPGATNTIAVFPFTLQNEAVSYARNTNGEGCAWSSIAGQVFDLTQGPLIGLVIQVTGDNFQQIALSGSERRFGASGYEIFLNSTPVEAEYVVQLRSTTGMPLSEPYVVKTLSSCDHNIAIVNFLQNHELP